MRFCSEIKAFPAFEGMKDASVTVCQHFTNLKKGRK